MRVLTTSLLSIALAQAGVLPETLATFDDGQHPIKPSPPSHPPIPDLPPLGLGLWNSKGKDATHAVSSAFSANYTHFDGAAAYYNEREVGAGLSKKSAPPRHTYWLTSKLWNTMHRPLNVIKAFNQTLAELNTTYLDLYLMHWPVAFLPPDKSSDRNIIDQNVQITDTWRAMEILASAYDASDGAYGARYIGISNFSPRQIEKILEMCTICPFAHEFEAHPYLQQQEFINWHTEHNIRVIAYSPLANLNPTYGKVVPDLPPILEDEFWVKMAKKKNCTVPQAVLAWGAQRGTSVIPKSVRSERIEENIGSLRVRYSQEEIQEIARQDKKIRFNNPSKGWGVELFEGLDGGSNRFAVDEL